MPKHPIPNFLVWIQCFAFVTLYSCWILPEIVGVRNTSLVLGAAIGVYVIYIYRRMFVSWLAAPLWFIFLLFIWSITHLIFFGYDYQSQAIELHRIWRYAFLASLFALGFGLTLGSESTPRQKFTLYFALNTPVFIYLLKYLVTALELNFGINIPPSLRLSYIAYQPFYIPKTDYVAFTLPALAVSLSCLIDLFSGNNFNVQKKYLFGAFHIVAIVVTCFLYLDQNIKNGMLYTLCLFIIFSTVVVFSKSNLRFGVRFGSAIVSLVFFGLVAHTHIQKNESWQNLVADAKVAVQLNEYRNWMDTSSKGYPINELGRPVIPTNYERITWGIVGLQMAISNPMGYGLIEDSFVHIVRRELEGDFNLSHSHSGWLDLALGIGIPGLLLIWTSMFLIFKESRNLIAPWGGFIFWSQITLFLLWITTEVSANVTFPELVFWICLSGGVCMTAGNVKKIKG